MEGKFSEFRNFRESDISLKVIFSQVSVLLFRRVPRDHCPWYTGPHCTPPTLAPTPPNTRFEDPLAPASDIWWLPLKTCSNLFIRPHCTGPLPQEQHLVAIEGVTVSTSGWCASYWNAFLLVNAVAFSRIFGIDFQIFYCLLMADTKNELQ